jgi:hypothetical protein
MIILNLGPGSELNYSKSTATMRRAARPRCSVAADLMEGEVLVPNPEFDPENLRFGDRSPLFD